MTLLFRVPVLILFLTFLELLGAMPSQGETLKDIQDRGVIRIGVKDNLPLMGLQRPDGELEGLEIDLSRRLVRTIWGDRLPIEFIPLKNQQRLSHLAESKVDLIIANLRVTDSRRRVAHFSQPYLNSRTQLLGSQSKPVQKICDSKIGVLQGSIAIGRLFSKCPRAEYVGLNSYEAALKSLANREIQLFAGDSVILQGMKNSNPQLELEFVPMAVGLSQVAVAMPKGLQHQSLHQAVDLALETLEETGDLQQMRNIWGLSAN